MRGGRERHHDGANFDYEIGISRQASPDFAEDATGALLQDHTVTQEDLP